MFIANIIVGNKRVRNNYLFCELVNVTEDYDSVDKTLPTLFVGISVARKYFPDIKIYKKEISKNIFWTFSKTECRDENETDFTNFKKFVKKYTLKNIKYIYFNIFINNFNKIKGLINYSLNDKNKKFLSRDGKTILVCSGSTIVGLSTSDIEYCGININKVIKKYNILDISKGIFKEGDLDYLGNNNIIAAYAAYCLDS